MPERTLMRLGAVSAIAGGILAALVNALHPRFTDYDNLTAEILEKVPASDSWIGIHIGLLFAGLLLTGGFVVFSRTVGGPRGRALGRLGYAGALIGGALAVVVAGIDGPGLKAVAEATAADSSGTSFAVLDAVDALSTATFSVFVIVVLGAVPLLFGFAVALGEGYPKWLGWLALVAGATGLAAGLIQAYEGITATTNLLVTLAAAVLTLWVLIVGVLMWRNSAAA